MQEGVVEDQTEGWCSESVTREVEARLTMQGMELEFYCLWGESFKMRSDVINLLNIL